MIASETAPDPSNPRAGSDPGPPKFVLWTMVGVVAIAIGLRIAATHTVAGNWDEFGLFEAASKTSETGRLVSGGRPGLAQLLVLSWVDACLDEIRVLRTARLLWVLFTVAYVAGVGVLLRQLQRDPQRRFADAWLGVALIALVPAFLEWSVQVRTDQIALAGGVWGGVALLASRKRPLFAALAGIAFAVGFLSSQKLLYAATAMGILCAAQLWFAREWFWKREAARVGLMVCAFASVIALFQAAASRQQIDISSNAAAVTGVSAKVVAGGLFAFDFYTKTIGWSQYIDMAPTLGPHILLFAALACATWTSRGRRGPGRDALPVAWALLVAGLAIGLFHKAAFAYFAMTLLLFPALAFAIAREPIVGLLPQVRSIRATATIGFWFVLATPGVATMALLLDDTQAVQRESFSFVRSNFPPDSAGFHPESGLFCRGEGQPIRHYYSHDIYRHFGAPGTEDNPSKLIRRFREEPILFLVESFRLNQFPVEVRRFWADNYQPYRSSVFVAGRRLTGRAGRQLTFELIAPGVYRWLPEGEPRTVSVDGRLLRPGETIELDTGSHVAGFATDDGNGILVLALAEPPGLAPLSFYKGY